jgi:hypothetical protein
MTVTIAEALRSDRKRRERDLELAAWCGLAEDEVGPFLRRLQVYDARTVAWEARQAAREAALTRLDADLAAFWREVGPPAPPAPRAGARRLRRLRPVRIG